MMVAVKINGTLKYVLSEPEKVVEVSDGGGGGVWGWLSDTVDGVWEWMNNTADTVVQAEFDFIMKPIVGLIKAGFKSLIDLLNAHSVDIIMIGVMSCSIGMIVAPLLGSNSGKWFGRVLFVCLVGAIWRLLI